jgi:hypothetical protein
MSKYIFDAFKGICEAMHALRQADVSLQDPIYTGLERSALKICDAHEDSVKDLMCLAMISGSSPLFQRLCWNSAAPMNKEILSFTAWADDEDLSHFIACEPQIGNCLYDLAVAFSGYPESQDELLSYIARGPCLGDEMESLIIDTSSFGFGQVKDIEGHNFYARMIIAVVKAHPQEAKRHLIAAIEAPLNEVAIALLLAGAQISSKDITSRGSPGDIGEQMSSAHGRMKLISEHGPLAKYLAQTALF